MKQKQLSVALAVYNEEKNIFRCLNSIRDIATEIIIVDGGSTDKTIEIAKQFNTKIIQTDNPRVFHINKQKALDQCTCEWVLQLDADEEVSKKLKEEIARIITMTDDQRLQTQIHSTKKKLFMRHERLVSQRDQRYETSGPIVGYYLARRNFFLGKPMTYAGMYPDGVIRLFKNGKAYFPAKSVHEQIVVEGKTSWLEHDLYHYSNPTLKRYVTGANTYTLLLAKQIKSEKKPVFILFISYCFIKPTITFFQLFIRHKGFLDGVHGFLFSLFSACHFPVGFWQYINKYE